MTALFLFAVSARGHAGVLQHQRADAAGRVGPPEAVSHHAAAAGRRRLQEEGGGGGAER